MNLGKIIRLIWVNEIWQVAQLWASQVALVVKNPPAKARDSRDVGSIPGSRRFPGEKHGNPLQYSCLENLMDRGSWQFTFHGVTESQTGLKQRSTTHHWPLPHCVFAFGSVTSDNTQITETAAGSWSEERCPSQLRLICSINDVVVLVAQSCPTLQPHGLQPARLLCPWDFPGRSTGVGCHFLLQGIFLTQRLNPGPLHCRCFTVWTTREATK